MKNRSVRWIAMGLVLGAAVAPLAAQEVAVAVGPAELQVDNLKTPLGIDDPAPRFAWQMRDAARGAKQTAYEVQVASRAELLERDRADVWTTGRVDSDRSIQVPYGGPALRASTRYYWRVKLWGAGGKAYPASEASWWETGLMQGDGAGLETRATAGQPPQRRRPVVGDPGQETGATKEPGAVGATREPGTDGATEEPGADGWHAQWIGYETPEEAAVRHAPAKWITSPDAKLPQTEKNGEQHFAYRTTVTLAKPVESAVLYATGQDTVSAWINGAQAMTAGPLPAWNQMPWKKFARAEVTGKLSEGANSIAIEAVHYGVNPNGMETADPPPMMATLVARYSDGSMETFVSGTEWKTAFDAAPGWQQKGFDDSGWKAAVQFVEGPTNEPLGHPWRPDSVKTLRRSFTVEKPVKSARLNATALGAYEMFLNGKRVGDQVLAPGWTDYRERVVYQTYDVTDLVRQGENAIGALLAPGWYETPLGGTQQPNNYGDTPPAVRAQLRIEHTDGTVEWVATDASWQAAISCILHSELYDGETANPGDCWVGESSPKFDDNWIHERATIIHPAPVKIVAQDFPPIRVERELKAVSLAEPKPGVYVYDFGQNFSGTARVTLRVLGRGRIFQVHFAEVLNPEGTIYTDNLRTAKATDSFVILGLESGRHTQRFETQFTFHGFRYVELTGLPTAPVKDAIVPAKDDVVGLVFHTDAPFTVKLTTGSAMINQLWSNILWGQRSNFVGVPTDCPQRDERLGWMGDAQVFWRTASYNMDLAAFSRKFAADMRGTQAGTPYYGIFSPGVQTESADHAPGWSDAGVIIPWTSWLETGDTTIVEENWAAMTKYLDAIEANNPDGLWKNDAGIPFGDWLSPEGKTDQTLIATAYWAYDVTLMRQMAHATGRTQEEEKYARLFEKIRAAFEKQFVHGDGFVAGADNSAPRFGAIDNPNAKSQGGDTQTGYVLALHMNLVPDDLRAAAAKRLADKIAANHDLLGTGFLGTPYLLEELTKAGYAKLAYTLLLNTNYPSWGYMVTHGATTMWERWNSDQMLGDPGMNSLNHYAYGAVGDWIYRYAAGVDATPLDAGFHTVVLHPVFDARLGSIAFDYESAYGAIHSDWKIDNRTAEWHVTIPANTTGWLPLSAGEARKYRLEGDPLAESKLASATVRGGQSGFALAPGSYTFEVEL